MRSSLRSMRASLGFAIDSWSRVRAFDRTSTSSWPVVPGDLTTPVGPSDTVHVIPAVSGGCAGPGPSPNQEIGIQSCGCYYDLIELLHVVQMSRSGP